MRSLGLVSVVMVVATSACATLQQYSSGQTGCGPDEIVISNEEHALGVATWTAECRGQKYFCSAHGGGKNATAQVSCSGETTRRDQGSSGSPGGASLMINAKATAFAKPVAVPNRGRASRFVAHLQCEFSHGQFNFTGSRSAEEKVIREPL
jgi:hypothetical protein